MEGATTPFSAIRVTAAFNEVVLGVTRSKKRVTFFFPTSTRFDLKLLEVAISPLRMRHFVTSYVNARQCRGYTRLLFKLVSQNFKP